MGGGGSKEVDDDGADGVCHPCQRVEQIFVETLTFLPGQPRERVLG